MSKFIDAFKDNLNLLESNPASVNKECFFYKLENFDIFDTLEYEKFCIGFSEVIMEHTQEDIFDKTLLADAIHFEYGVMRSVVLESESLEFLHKGVMYSKEEFDEVLYENGMDFVDYGLFFYSYLLQQYCLRNLEGEEQLEDYILNKELLRN